MAFQRFEIKWAHFYHNKLKVHAEFFFKVKKWYKPDTIVVVFGASSAQNWLVKVI